MSGVIREFLSHLFYGRGDPEIELDEDDPQNVNASEPITILEVLNPDCWRAVLDWLDADDVVRSERVSRGWQQVVQEYILGVRSYYIDNNPGTTTQINRYYKYNEYHKLKIEDICLLKKMVKKMGPFIVTLLLDDSTTRWLRLIIENCPDLEDVTFFKVNDAELPLDCLVENCKRLKRVTFESCELLCDDNLRQLITHETLEELVINERIYIDNNVSGHFLSYLKSTNLKKLAFNKCNSLKFQHILSAASFLTELTALELDYIPRYDTYDYFDNVHFLLDKTPKLEHLSLNNESNGFYVKLNTELVESIGRLSRLKSLSMDGIATDALLIAVARGCKELRSLSIQMCPGVRGRAVVSLCRELTALTELSVAANHELSDEDLTACITSCHDLKMLDVSWCSQVTVALVAACAREVRRRPRPLRLRLYRTAVTADSVQALFDEEKRMGLELSWFDTETSLYYYEELLKDPFNDYHERLDSYEPDY